MVFASPAWRRLGLALLLLVGSGCEGRGELRTRPTSLSEPVESCKGVVSPHGLKLPTWDLFVVDASWAALMADVNADVEVSAQICLGGQLEPIGLELQGTSGRTRAKKSFKIKLGRDHTLTEVGLAADSRELIDKVYLKAVWIDPGMIRESVAFDLWRSMGHDAPRTDFANLRINGDYWGLYSVVEPVDKDYLRRNGYPKGGRLYKATRKHGSRADFAPGRDLTKAFEDKNADGEMEWRGDLEALVTTLQETPLEQEAFEREIDPIFSLDDYIDRIAWVSYTRNGDAVAQNFYLYNYPEDDHDSWSLIPWDSDLCLGSSWRGPDVVVPADVSLMLDGGNYFSKRLTATPGLRERYVARYRALLDDVFTEAQVTAFIERRANRVRADLPSEQARWHRTGDPEDAFDVMRTFATERPEVLRTGLAEQITMPTEGEEPVGTTEDIDES